MRRIFLFLLVLAWVQSGVCAFAAGEEAANTAGVSVGDETVETGPNLTGKEVGNTVCPVSGAPVAAMNPVKIKYHGKIYNLCCDGCIQDFKDHPAKYATIAESKAAKGTGTSLRVFSR